MNHSGFILLLPEVTHALHLQKGFKSSGIGRPQTSMGMAQYAVFRSPWNFKDPQVYLPERWLDDNEEYACDKKEALQPFSFGPRNCIGRNLANIEMRLILAKLIWHFDLELMADSMNWPEKQYIYTSWEKIPLKIKLHPVQH